jgi:hypothetical protein
MRVIQLAVRDANYPRNSRIRRYLESHGYRVDVVTVPTGSYFGRCWGLLVAGYRVGPARVVICSELGVQYAWVSWLLAKCRRSTLWVDYFVGMYETNVLDWKETRQRSIRALTYRAFDWAAINLGDIVTTDTDIRSKAAQKRRRRRSKVLTLPVGAPTWAKRLPYPGVGDDNLRLLYYGNYLPLHGLPFVIDAVERASRSRPVHLTLIGDGQLRGQIERKCAEVGLMASCTFLGAIPEEELEMHIGGAHAVIGVFGDSEKAAGVIANKVWQGLACGRFVVTRRSEALDEIAAIARDLLIQVDVASDGGLVEALLRIPSSEPSIGDVSLALEAYVSTRYSALDHALAIDAIEGGTGRG